MSHPTNPPWLALRWILAGTALAAAIIVPFLLFGEQMEALSSGLVVGADRATVALLLGFALLVADVFLPIPSSLVMTGMALFAGAFPAWIASFLGLSTGAALGYVTGLAFGPAAIHKLVGDQQEQHLTRWMARNGYWVIAACRAVPVLAEASVIVAGASRMPAVTTLLTAGAASALVPIPYVIAGSIASSDATFYWAFGLSMALSGLLWLFGRRSTS